MPNGHRTLPGGIALLVALGGLGFAAGTLTLGGALALALSCFALAAAWYRLPIPYTLAIGHVLLLGFVPDGAPLLRVLPVEIGFAGLLVSEAPTTDLPVRFAGAALLAAAALGVATWAGLAWSGALWAGALALALVAAVVAYGLHRYELLALDLLEATT